VGKHGVRVQVAELTDLLRLAPQDGATLSQSPSPPWASVYTTEGFDPIDGANRVHLLSRSRHVVYAYAGQGDNGQALAAGTGSIARAGSASIACALRPPRKGAAWRRASWPV